MKIEMKPIIFGEREKEHLLARNGNPFIAGKCFFCDFDVWVSEYGINPAASNITHVKVKERIEKNKITRFLHKDCLLYATDAVVTSLAENLKYRGE